MFDKYNFFSLIIFISVPQFGRKKKGKQGASQAVDEQVYSALSVKV